MPDRERAQGDQLHVEVRRVGDLAIARLLGELDLASAPLLESEIESAARDSAKLVLDLDGLEFIDSTGLRLILLANERATEEGRDFAVTKGSAQVRRILEITGVDEHLQIVDSPEELLV